MTEPRILDWVVIEPGDIVWSEKDHHAWMVMERDGIQFTIEREGRKPITGNFTGKVKVVATAAEVMADAVSTVADGLGGRVLDVEADGTYLCPVEYDEPGTLMAHLYRLHGYRFPQDEPEETLRELAVRHAAMHKTPEAGYIHHHHDPAHEAANADKA